MSTTPLNPLVEKIRAKYPGAYDDLSDAQLTQKIIAKYPQYSDLARPYSQTNTDIAAQVRWDEPQASTPQVQWDEPQASQQFAPAPLPSLAERFINTMPGIGQAHRLAGAVQQWAQSKEPLNGAPSGPIVGGFDLKQLGAGVLADTAGAVRAATGPTGLATTAAMIAAPEVTGPALMAHGGYNLVKGWGDLSNPDVLQNELNAAGEAVGGVALTGAAVKAGGGPITQAVRQQVAASKAAQAPAQAAVDFQRAVPPMKSAPYTALDYAKARPYLETEHGAAPIEDVQGLRDAADNAIGGIEDKIQQAINQLPNAQFRPTVLQDVKTALQSNARGQAFVNAGLKDLQDFNFDQPKTLADLDTIRRQLNLENQATLAQNNYKTAAVRASDPAFAAREAAAESLRDQIYSQLSANGMPDAQQLRLDEGSLIKIRNAAQNQIFNADKKVGGTGASGVVPKIAKGIAQAGLTGAGAYVGGWPGAIVGREIGNTIGPAFNTENMTRNALIDRSFSNAKPVPTPAPVGTQNTVPLAAMLGTQRNQIEVSDGQ